jgi:hypothetical protein
MVTQPPHDIPRWDKQSMHAAAHQDMAAGLMRRGHVDADHNGAHSGDFRRLSGAVRR